MAAAASLLSRKDLIRKLLKGIETGDAEAAAVVNEAVYIQHNPQTQEGSEGLAALFKRLSQTTNPRVNVVRAFEDGDFVFGHTEYDFSTRRIGFEVFRFEGNQAVEHWDNIQPRMLQGDEMIAGPTEATDLDRTEINRERLGSFVQNAVIPNRMDLLSEYVAQDLIQHSPYVANQGRDALESYLSSGDVKYEKLHRVLAEGSFCLAVSEGYKKDKGHVSFYDLYRIAEGLLVEHWDTIEAIPPKSEWKNNNGKF